MPETSSPLPQADVSAAEAGGLLTQRPFRMWCWSRFLSRVPQNAINFALVLLIVDETGLAFMSSLLVLVLVVPSTFAGIISGVAADVLPKRPMILVGCLARAVVCYAFAQSAGGEMEMFLTAFALASLAPISSSAEGALQPVIVERPDLARANAIAQAIGSAAQLIGLGVLTPFVLRLLDSPDGLFYVCALLYVGAGIAGLMVGRVRRLDRLEVGGDSPGPWWAVGWRAMRADPAVLGAAIELTLISTTLIILGGLIPSFISDTLGLRVDIGAVVLFPAAIGVVVGLRVAGFLAHRVPHALLSSIGFAGFVLLLAMLAFVEPEARFLSGYGAFSWLNNVSIGNFDRTGVLAMLIVLPLGFSYAVVTVAGQTVINDRVALQLQGRVQATQAAMAGLAASLPVLAAGALADVVDVNVVIAIVAALIGAAAVANLRTRRRARSIGPVSLGGVH